jgi:hypothetical protein
MTGLAGGTFVPFANERAVVLTARQLQGGTRDLGQLLRCVGSDRSIDLLREEPLPLT